MTCIVSAVYGDYDRPKVPLPQSVPVRYLMVTDDIHKRAPGWDIIVDHRARCNDEHPRLAAKRPKLHPWLLAPHDGPWIWVDGHIEIQSRHFAEQVLAAVDVVGMWEHPDRRCALAEARFSATLPKYRDTPVNEQASHYWQMGHPEDWGLWAAGVIVYKFELPHLGNEWWDEIQKWGFQDQVSLPIVLRRLQMRPDPLPYGLRDNPWISIRPHKDGTS